MLYPRGCEPFDIAFSSHCSYVTPCHSESTWGYSHGMFDMGYGYGSSFKFHHESLIRNIKFIHKK